MTDLSPELQKLVLAGKSASRPTSTDFDRVLGALQARLGEAAVTAPVASTATGLLSSKMVSITLAAMALVIGGAAWVSSRSADVAPSPAAGVSTVEVVPSTETTAVTLASVSIAETATPVPAEVTPPQTQPKSSQPAAAARDPGRARDSLSEEVAILSRAETELHSGHAESALRLLAEHERKFSNGILAEERTAARIQALCALGRSAEANTQMARLRPGSLHSEQSQKACANATAKPAN